MKRKSNPIGIFLLAVLVLPLLPPSIVTAETGTEWEIPQTLAEFDELKYTDDLSRIHSSVSTDTPSSPWNLLEKHEAEAHLHLGVYFMEQGQHQPAEVEFKKTLELNPDHALGHFNLGLLYNEQKKLDAAKTEYNEAIRLDPSLHIAHTNLGTVNLVQKEYQEATQNFKTAIGLEPEDLKAHISLGHLYYYVFKNFPAAKKEYKKALKLDPKIKLAQTNLKAIYKDERAARRLERQFERSLKKPASKRSLAEEEIIEESLDGHSEENPDSEDKKDLFHF